MPTYTLDDYLIRRVARNGCSITSYGNIVYVKFPVGEPNFRAFPCNEILAPVGSVQFPYIAAVKYYPRNPVGYQVDYSIILNTVH